MSYPKYMQKTLAAAIALASIEALAQTNSEDTTLRAEEIVVIGTIPYRNRSEATEPVLEYDAEYFQRFEPLTAGDALRRVPSVTFLSDVIESDGPQLRGLAPSYNQILINGERVPGGENDRSFFMDRIPAELIDRVEIIRSSSARRTGDAMAGSLNMVLRDGYSLEGGYVRLGALRFDDGEFKPSLAAVYGAKVDDSSRILLGANIQGRYNPKLKDSLRYGDSPENNPNFRTDDFDNREDQTDTRDGTDYSFNGRYTTELDNGSEFELGGFLTYTDREQAERSFEYDDPTAISGPVPTGNLLSDNQQLQETEQTSYVFDSAYKFDAFGGRMDIRLGYAVFDEDLTNNEDEIDFEDLEVDQERELADISDEELTLKIAETWDLDNGVKFETGIYWQDKQRDNTLQAGDQDIDFTASDWDQFSQNVFSLRTRVPDVEIEDGGDNRIEETRADLYGVFNGVNNRLSWEVGLRYETTDTTITDVGASVSADNDYDFLLPSASLKYELTNVDRLTASAARTVRRPQFDLITPFLDEGGAGEDDDLLGNPNLEPETAYGFDLGYERRISQTGVFGINFFYRQVDDLIELVNTGAEGSEGPGFFVYQAQNIGDGDVYGLEFDMSTPLSAFGMDNTGVFANYSWLDSETTDFIGERRFNDQSDFVYNLGFIHSFPDLGAAFGASYRKQGDALTRVLAEEITTSYGADLEIFIEKSYGQNLTLRLVGQNLLDASKDETFNKFETAQDQIDRNFDEYELETESAGAVFQLMARYAF